MTKSNQAQRTPDCEQSVPPISGVLSGKLSWNDAPSSTSRMLYVIPSLFLYLAHFVLVPWCVADLWNVNRIWAGVVASSLADPQSFFCFLSLSIVAAFLFCKMLAFLLLTYVIQAIISGEDAAMYGQFRHSHFFFSLAF